MYVIRVEATKKLRAWHQETPAGLQAAVEECEMRTHATNMPHIVTDNNGYRLHLSLPPEVKRRLKEQREHQEGIPRWLSVCGLLILLVVIFSRR